MSTQPHLEKLFGDLRALVTADGYRPSDLARALGVDRRKVDRWLNRHVAPNAEDALALADLVRRMKRRARRARKKPSPFNL
jgi:transcriptional regulator with XRE-family HTH domain